VLFVFAIMKVCVVYLGNNGSALGLLSTMCGNGTRDLHQLFVGATKHGFVMSSLKLKVIMGGVSLYVHMRA
jgi:hypothetical protein